MSEIKKETLEQICKNRFPAWDKFFDDEKELYLEDAKKWVAACKEALNIPNNHN